MMEFAIPVHLLLNQEKRNRMSNYNVKNTEFSAVLLTEHQIRQYQKRQGMRTVEPDSLGHSQLGLLIECISSPRREQGSDPTELEIRPMGILLARRKRTDDSEEKPKWHCSVLASRQWSRWRSHFL